MTGPGPEPETAAPAGSVPARPSAEPDATTRATHATAHTPASPAPDEPPPAPPAAPGPVGRLVVVDDGRGPEPALGPGGQPERRSVARRLDDAALVAVRVPTGILAALLATVAAVAALGAVAAVGAGAGPSGAGGGAASAPWQQAAGPVVAAAAALGLAAWAGWPQVLPRHRQRLLQAVLVLATLAAGALPWTVDAAHRPLAMAGTLLFGLAGAALLAPMRRGGWLVACAPGLAGAAVLSDPGRPHWLALGLLASLTATAVALLAHRAWRQQMKTFLRQAEQLAQLARDCADAQRADQDKSRLLGIASHDLRQPVHAIGLFAASLMRRLQQSPEEPLVRNLAFAVDGLERSFNAILDLSKLDGGALTARPQTFQLRDMFRRLHMQYAGQAELAGLSLRFSPGGKSVTSDPQLLERVVGNLVQNAIKYTTQGGVVVVARNTATHLNLEVWDTGSGMAPDELPRIFGEFYQIDRHERDRTHGLGMGLAIVKRLVALLGHRLEVVSVPGRGTLFRIGLPLSDLTGLQDELAPADTLPMPSLDTKVILVVDDEEPIREGLRLLLQEWGFQAVTAADAVQADLAVKLLEGRVDLVLSDLYLGDGQDGRHVIANVRRLCGHAVPAILVTGETQRDDLHRLPVGQDMVLLKPVQPRRLYEAVRAALR